MTPRILPVVAALAVTAAVGVAFLGIGRPDAACLPAGCDCETVGAAPIRQPVNAWSSLALASAGIALLSKHFRAHPGPGFGIAVAISGIAAFWFHASSTAWAAQLDGIAVAGIAAVVAAGEWSDRIPAAATAGAAGAVIAGSAWVGTGALGGATVVLAVCAAAGAARPERLGSRALRPLWTAGLLFAAAGAAWWLGRSGGVWCAPDGPLILHGIWHVLAAAALLLLGIHLASDPAPRRNRRTVLRS